MKEKEMQKKTEQMQVWLSSFGKEYTERNAIKFDKMEALYTDNYGFTRSDLNERFMAGIDKSSLILEVGSNVGNQLLCLQKAGFRNLFGIELQSYAVELSKQRTHNINIIQGSAFDIPFKDKYFDLVFTSGVLIHINPLDITKVLSEIHRCSKSNIWGFEYYSDNYVEVPYRGQTNLLWKADFARQYLERFNDLDLIKEERIKYLNSENMDSMFMLRKKG